MQNPQMQNPQMQNPQLQVGPTIRRVIWFRQRGQRAAVIVAVGC